jgi:hypothetical protein
MKHKNIFKKFDSPPIHHEIHVFKIIYLPFNMIWLVMKLLFQILCKWISISSLFKRLFLEFYANGFPYIFFVQEFFLWSSLQIGAHIFFSQDLHETTSCKSNSWTNQICSKFHKINSSLKLHQELFFSEQIHYQH